MNNKIKFDLCEVPHCRNQANMDYYFRRICEKCWKKYCDDNKINLKEIFKIKDQEIKKNDDWKNIFKIKGGIRND